MPIFAVKKSRSGRSDIKTCWRCKRSTRGAPGGVLTRHSTAFGNRELPHKNPFKAAWVQSLDKIVALDLLF